MRTTASVLTLLALFSGGCFEPAPSGPAPIERPADWDAGVALLAYSGFRAHSADENQRLAPPEDSAVAAPAYCGAYQDGVRKGRDTCAVQGPEEDFDRSWGPWTIEASWDGRGEDLVATERAHGRRTVVAFDEEGTPIAWWAGQRHPDGGMAVE